VITNFGYSNLRLVSLTKHHFITIFFLQLETLFSLQNKCKKTKNKSNKIKYNKEHSMLRKKAAKSCREN
jgi:hypothetical protein